MKRLMFTAALLAFLAPTVGHTYVDLKMWCCRRDLDTKMCVKICNSPPINLGPECTPCLYGCINGVCKDPPLPGT